MKTRRIAATATGLMAIIFLLATQNSPAQTPTVSISPNIISNNYIGPVTVTVSNITTGKTVNFGLFLDANTNGKIDPGEYELRNFNVTDGAQAILGGATNVNVPGDSDGAANGHITTVMNFPGVTTLAAIAGSYLLRISDPSNVFNPVTNSFTIVQAPASQGVTGTASANGQPLTNAVVVLAAQKGNGIGAVADVHGHFSINAAPGAYNVLAGAPGYVGLATPVVVSSNSFATANTTNVTETGVLSGTIADSSTSNGLPGIFVTAQGGAALVFGFTDTNGNFSLPAIANQWKIKLNSSSGLAAVGPYGYVAFQNSSFSTNLTSGSATNINFSYPRATALFYGQLTDNHSNALTAAEIEADSADNRYVSDGATDANGRYAIGVLSNDWQVGPLNLASNYLVQTTNVSILNNQAIPLNIQADLITAYLFGKLVDAHGNPQTNTLIVVNAVETNGFLTPLNQSYTTADDGTFAIGLYGGTWNIAPECNSAGLGGLVPPSLNFTVVDGINQSNILLIELFATTTISGSFKDTNGNPVNGIAFASTTVNGTNYSPCGGGSGETNTYQIAVFPGEWTVGVSGNFTASGYDNPANQNVNVTGSGATVNFIFYPLGQTPPQLANPAYVSGNFEFSVQGDPNQNYCVQVSTNLKTWKSLVTNTAYGGSFYFQDNSVTNPARYYRAVLVP
jgi:hypothetical protein